MEFPVEKIEAMIYKVRGHRVMLDSDLARLYGIETKALNQAVRRNLSRFPDDFLIHLSSSELADLRSQIVTLDGPAHRNLFKHLPFLFTENGVAMLSSILRGERAIQVNITIMRTFTKLRSFLAMESSLHEDVGKLKRDTNHLFKVVFERLDSIESEISPKLPANRKKIGLRSSEK